MFSSALQRAITRGMKPDGDLAEELGKLDDYTVRSRKDARAICEALGALSAGQLNRNDGTSPLHALTSLFQSVEGMDVPAFEVLREDGLPRLTQILDANIDTADERTADDLMFVLKILAMYGTREGAEKIVETARRPLKSDGYMWHPILSRFSDGHPQAEFVFEALREPLPDKFIAVALLDSANGAAIKGELPNHPFDSPVGWRRLQDWLEDREPEHFSYAHSATAALPFVSNPPRDQLLALAMDHLDAGVQMEAAWAAGKLGREAGLKVLARFSLDVNHSDVAKRYLVELDREDLIPAAARDASFQAKAEFAGWLAHPNELGQPPDELEIVDHRLLAWPPDHAPAPFWLLRYRMRDLTGLEADSVDCGLVGSITWCFFSYEMNQRPPEDAYAIHCFWEMEHARLIDETEVTDAAEYAGLLGQWKGDQLDSAKVTRIVEISPKLKAPGRLVAVASSKLSGKEGWVVLDGPRSSWYPRDDQPRTTTDKVVLMIHVGRQLLGFHGDPDRARFLERDQPVLDPHRIVASYEKLLAEASNGSPERQKELLGSFGLLARYFEAYVEALVAVHGGTELNTKIEVYERLLKLAANTSETIRGDVYDSLGVLGGQFESYVEALVSIGRTPEIPVMIELFSPHWDHNLGYGKLGSAAFKVGELETAERFFLKLRQGLKCYYRSEEMSMLATIWHRRGESEQARELLLDCMRKTAKEIQESKYNSDREIFAGEFQQHRATYLRLFPGEQSELASLGIPANPH